MGMNTAAVEARIRALGVAMLAGAQRGVDKCAQELLTRSVGDCPIEEGTLQRSGRVVSRGDGSAGVGFGSGGAEEYAVYVHEDGTAHHDHGTAHFLSKNHRAMEAAGTYLQIIGNEVQRGMS